MTNAIHGTLAESIGKEPLMSLARVFGNFRPRLNIGPLLLTPGFAAIGYAIGGAAAAWWAVAAWLAVILGAVVSCAVHALRAANQGSARAGGRRAFDYDANNAGN
jgi:fatty acid desaturase